MSKKFQKTFIKDTKFFFTDFHTGTVNILFHIVSVAVFIYGIVIKDLMLTILGIAVIDEMGHIYNYFYLHKKDPKFDPIRMLPYQALYVVPLGLIVSKLFGVL